VLWWDTNILEDLDASIFTVTCIMPRVDLDVGAGSERGRDTTKPIIKWVELVKRALAGRRKMYNTPQGR
jgi:hypothetical protein